MGISFKLLALITSDWPVGSTASRLADPEVTLVRTLVYPEGIETADGGLLGVIPGAPLLRDPFKVVG